MGKEQIEKVSYDGGTLKIKKGKKTTRFFNVSKKAYKSFLAAKSKELHLARNMHNYPNDS